MRVAFHGVRGSVPTPGPRTVRYGGNTSCVEVRLADGTVIVLDGGTGIRRLGRQLVEEDLRTPIHLLLTHLHWDHVIGVPFFAPIYRPTTTLVLHPLVVGQAGRRIQYDELFDGRHFPLHLHQLPAKLVQPDATAGPWRIGSAEVTPISLNHPGGSTGFRIVDEGKRSLVFLTDNELRPPGALQIDFDGLARFAQGADLLVHDAQYLDADMPDKLGWGHSTVAQVLELGRRAGVKKLVLYHHDPDRHDDALDAVARETRRWWTAEVKSGEVLVAWEGLMVNL